MTVAQVRSVLIQEDTVLFIGSGISCWSGLPTWYGLINELATYLDSLRLDAAPVRLELARGDLLQAASYGIACLTKHQFATFIRQSCRVDTAQPHLIHEKIARLPPRCFVTTNYDTLIEKSLATWRPKWPGRHPITNRHLIELAEIVQARATDFVFKPHGDVNDVESVVLTREQYRQLMPQGGRHSALDALKILLISRPVVYIGFGLRDPDFLHLRDIIANTYTGGSRDHYAIVADATPTEIAYWRDHYGIHLVPYATVARPDGSRDHGALLALLDTIHPVPSTAAPGVPTRRRRPRSGHLRKRANAPLVRYLELVARAPELARKIPLTISSAKSDEPAVALGRRRPYEGNSVETFLEHGPRRAILLGQPGAGKSYALRAAAFALARAELQVARLVPTLTLPILVDLRLYSGSIESLILASIPPGLSLKEILTRHHAKLFVDSFNEAPQDTLESGALVLDLQRFLTKYPRADLIITSRTKDGLEELELPSYSLDNIEFGTVETMLDTLGVALDPRFHDEFAHLLCRPFFFRYIDAKLVELPARARPRDFFHSLVGRTTDKFTSAFASTLDIERVLARVAYGALDRGEEAFAFAKLVDEISHELHTTPSSIDAQDVANWLVSTELVNPLVGRRAAFVHQSVTEYLAAIELVRRSNDTIATAISKLPFRRWDEALLTTIGLLPPAHALRLIAHIRGHDLPLALRATRHLEEGRDAAIQTLLAHILAIDIDGDAETDFGVSDEVSDHLPVTHVHTDILWQLTDKGDLIGSAASACLVRLKGYAVKRRLLHLMFKRSSDYNLAANGIGAPLSQFATESDVFKIGDYCDRLEQTRTRGSETVLDDLSNEEDDRFEGFVSGACHFLSSLDINVVRRSLLPPISKFGPDSLRARVMCGLLQNRKTNDSLFIALDLLHNGIAKAISSIYFVCEFAGDDLNWRQIKLHHVECIAETVCDARGTPWGAVAALRQICLMRSDLARRLRQSARHHSSFKQSILLWCATGSDLHALRALSDVLAMTGAERAKMSFKNLELNKLQWARRPDLLLALLRLRDARLANELLSDGFPADYSSMPPMDVGPIRWWLDWISELSGVGRTGARASNGQWIAAKIGTFLSKATLAAPGCLHEFNRRRTRFRRVLGEYVIPHMESLSTDDLSEWAIAALIDDLSLDWKDRLLLDGSLLGATATEQVVSARLLPLLGAHSGSFSSNLRSVLDQCGRRHARRY